MSSTVEIVVKGIALWFKKEGFWNALLPFDDCHIVDFSHGTADGPPSRRRSLARKNGKIKISRVSGSEVELEPTPAFKREVLDLSSRGSSYITHRKVKKKTDWADKAVYLRIGSAKLSVFDYVQDLTDDPLLLHGTLTRLQRLDSVAHWVKATIEIPDAETVKIDINGMTVVSFSGTANENYHVVINNDCHNLSEQNDMMMYYDNVITGYEDDGATVSEKFWVGELNPLDSSKSPMVSLPAIESLAEHSSKDFWMALKLWLKILTGDASLLEGKPCMNVQVTDNDDLPIFS